MTRPLPLLVPLLLASLAGCLTNGDSPHYAPGTDAVAPREVPVHDWPTFGGSNLGWNFHPDAEVPYCKASRPDAWRECVAAEWKVHGINTGTHTAAKSSAVVRDGVIFVGSDSGRVHAFLPDGTELWNATTEPSRSGIHGTPAVQGDRVYIGAYDGAMYSFNATTGQRVWRSELGSWIGSSPRVHDGHVYIAVEHGGTTQVGGHASTRAWGDVQILDAETGQRLWRSDRLGSHPHSTIAVSPDDNAFVVGCNDGRVYAWDLDDRGLRWDFQTEGPGDEGDVKGPILVHDGAAFFGSWDHNFYRVDLDTGEADWVFQANDWIMTGSAVDPERGLVYFGSHDAHVYAVDATTGEEVWRVQTGARIVGSPTLTPDVLLFGSNDYHLYAIDPADGTVLWRYPTLHRVSSAPLVVGDRIVFPDRSEAEGDGTHGILYSLAPPA